MKKLIENLIRSFYVINKKYEYRTGKTTEISTRNFLAFTATSFLLDLFLYVGGIAGRFLYLRGTNLSNRIGTFLTLAAFTILFYIIFRKKFNVEYISSVLDKYADDPISKRKATLLLIATLFIVVSMLILTFCMLNVTSKYIK